MDKSLILGINAYHGDSSACLLHNGQLIAAAEEERFCRIKHFAGFPIESIRYCLKEGKIKLSEIAIIAINSDPHANFFKKILYTCKNKPNLKLILDRINNQKARLSIESDLAIAFSGEKFHGEIKKVEHHLAHLASTFFVSPFQEALVISVDGFGDFASCAWGIGKNNHIDIRGRICFPHSLGAFYQALTQYLGFPNYGDEYKVMGLAPYGQPRFMKQMYEIVKIDKNGIFKLNMKYFRYHREKLNYIWNKGSPEVETLYSDKLCALLGPERKFNDPLDERHIDIARSTQEMFEQALFHLLSRLHQMYPFENLAIAGGCAMNSVANGKIVQQTPFKKIYVPGAAGDAGGAIGAAMVVWHQISQSKNSNRFHCNHAYWGPRFSNEEINQIINQKTESKKDLQTEFIEDEKNLCRRTAQAIADGKVVGWFQGRMEWGPRALGNRSILCDPRRFDMKDILNLKIKKRECFRPFAPSILREAVSDWFELEDDVPFMTQVFKIRPEKRSLIPAVNHVDGTGRLQTVDKESNSRYYCLISTFEEKTEVPLILNTSFNENEPIVCRPEEALDCFLRTQMDVLVLNDFFIFRKEKN